jgi:hypothetical protein
MNAFARLVALVLPLALGACGATRDARVTMS